jgi:hypothetical protein
LTSGALTVPFLFEGVIEGLFDLFRIFSGILESHFPLEVLRVSLHDPAIECLPWLERVEVGRSDDGFYKSRFETGFEDLYGSSFVQV